MALSTKLWVSESTLKKKTKGQTIGIRLYLTRLYVLDDGINAENAETQCGKAAATHGTPSHCLAAKPAITIPVSIKVSVTSLMIDIFSGVPYLDPLS